MSRLTAFVSTCFCLLLSAQVSAAVHNVTVRNFEFDPMNVNAQIGDTIQWNWESGFHSITSGDNSTCTGDGIYFDELITSVDPTFSYVIPANAPAVIPYFCGPHCPSMPATITVTNAVPTMSEWGMIALTLTLVAAGSYVAARRQRLAQAAA